MDPLDCLVIPSCSFAQYLVDCYRLYTAKSQGYDQQQPDRADDIIRGILQGFELDLSVMLAIPPSQALATSLICWKAAESAVSICRTI
jgi:hypothetical protein